MMALALERITLTHTETMLLINDNEAEAPELHRIFDKGVGTDNAVDRAIGKTGEHRVLLTLLHLPGEQGCLHAKRCKSPLGASEMLTRQNLCRRHQSRLVPA